MPEALLIGLPIAGGFVAAFKADRSKFKIARETGYRFYFRVVHYALLLVGASILLTQLTWGAASCLGASTASFGLESELVWEILKDLVLRLHANNWQIAFLAFGLGSLAHLILNLPPGTQEKYVELAIEGDDFEQMVAESLASSKAIAITLKSQQVYIGLAVKAPNPATSRRWLRILPLASGYRDEKRKLSLQVNYGPMVKKTKQRDPEFLGQLRAPIKVSDFEVVISFEEITGMHFFDLDVYRVFDRDGAALFGEGN